MAILPALVLFLVTLVLGGCGAGLYPGGPYGLYDSGYGGAYGGSYQPYCQPPPYAYDPGGGGVYAQPYSTCYPQPYGYAAAGDVAYYPPPAAPSYPPPGSAPDRWLRHHQGRVNPGMRSGQLTPRGPQRLENRWPHSRRVEPGLKAGRPTPREQGRLKGSLMRSGGEIYRLNQQRGKSRPQRTWGGR
jgi:hypothetical protein